MNASRYMFAMLACAALASSSCRKEVIPAPSTNMTFNVLVDDYTTMPSGEVQTRALTDESASMTLYMNAYSTILPEVKSSSSNRIPTSFSCLGYTVKDTWYGTEMPDIFFDKKFSLNGPYWDSGLLPKVESKARFYAYAPCETVNATLASGRTSRGVPVLEVFAPSRSDQQVDILEAVTPDCSHKDIYPLSLSFRHALASVGFKFENFGFDCKVESIELTNVNSRGTTGIATGTWESSAPMTYSTSIPFKVEYGKVTNAPDRLLIIPQRFGSRSKLIVNVSIEGKRYSLQSSISDMELLGNSHTEFVISSSDKFLNLRCTPLQEVKNPIVGLTQNMIVHSYISTMNGKTVETTPIPWVMDFSVNGGESFSLTPPEWLKLSQTNGDGGDVGESIEVTIRSNKRIPYYINETSNKEDLARSQALKEKPMIGSPAEPIDLSYMDYTGKKTTTRNTANCYIVHQPGWYKIPLVYGNAIKNGEPNPSAYSGNGATFKDASGNIFTEASSPYIADPSQVEDFKASLNWYSGMGSVEVFPELIHDDECCYALIHFPKEYICECNLSVMVQSNNAAWSWHIWVTGRELTPVTVTKKDNTQTSLLSVTLGYNGQCQKKKPMTNWAMQSCIIRLRTPFGSKPYYTTARILPGGTVPSYTSTGTNSAPYYQWGRKDPLVCDFGSKNLTQAASHIEPSYMSIADKVFTDGGDFLWGTVKTIYDPCPAGWRVMSASTMDGYKALVRLESNISFSMGKNSVLFSATNRKTPSQKHESKDGHDKGHYWYVDKPVENNAKCLFFSLPSVSGNTSQSAPRSAGYCIRPEIDK